MKSFIHLDFTFTQNYELISTYKYAHSLQHTNFNQAIPKFLKAYNWAIFPF